MENIDQSAYLDKFFLSLSASNKTVLFLDYDGTLAPFEIKRDEALPYPGVRECLREIQEQGRTRLVIVSGREADDISSLLSLENCPEIFAVHGAVRRFPDGKEEESEQSDSMKKNVLQARDWAIKEGLKDYIEFKKFSIAFHWRGKNEETRQSIETKVKEHWSNNESENELTLLPFDGGIELRPKRLHKGLAIRTILDETEKDVPIAYLGDDLTDEDAFRELGDRGLKVLVRSDSRETLADIRITPPDELIEFLSRWNQVLSSTTVR